MTLKILRMLCLLGFSATTFAGQAGDIAKKYCRTNNCSGAGSLLSAMVMSPPEGTCLLLSSDSVKYLNSIESRGFKSNRSWWLLVSYDINSDEYAAAIEVAKSFASVTGRQVYLAEPYNDVEAAKKDYCTADFELWEPSLYRKEIIGMLVPKVN